MWWVQTWKTSEAIEVFPKPVRKDLLKYNFNYYYYHYPARPLPIFLHFRCAVIRQNCKHIFQVTTIASFVYTISQTRRGVNILTNINFWGFKTWISSAIQNGKYILFLEYLILSLDQWFSNNSIFLQWDLLRGAVREIYAVANRVYHSIHHP
jgi:hypothetical protein